MGWNHPCNRLLKFWPTGSWLLLTFLPQAGPSLFLKLYYISFQQRFRSVSKSWKDRGRRGWERGGLEGDRSTTWMSREEQRRAEEAPSSPPASAVRLAARTQLEVNFQPFFLFSVSLIFLFFHRYFFTKHLALIWKGRVGKAKLQAQCFISKVSSPHLARLTTFWGDWKNESCPKSSTLNVTAHNQQT